jgi:hypothetical protein
MPQSKWERGFWAAVRGGGTGGFNPYPPEHWRPKKGKKVKKRLKSKKKKYFLKEHIKIVTIPDTFFN